MPTATDATQHPVTTSTTTTSTSQPMLLRGLGFRAEGSNEAYADAQRTLLRWLQERLNIQPHLARMLMSQIARHHGTALPSAITHIQEDPLAFLEELNRYMRYKSEQHASITEPYELLLRLLPSTVESSENITIPAAEDNPSYEAVAHIIEHCRTSRIPTHYPEVPELTTSLTP